MTVVDRTLCRRRNPRNNEKQWTPERNTDPLIVVFLRACGCGLVFACLYVVFVCLYVRMYLLVPGLSRLFFFLLWLLFGQGSCTYDCATTSGSGQGPIFIYFIQYRGRIIRKVSLFTDNSTTWFNHAHCSTYTVLYLSSNQITSIPAGGFDQLTSLQQLYLNDNQITSIAASVFDQLTSLQGLYLPFNQIMSIPASVDQFTSLQELYLSNNQITSIPAGVLDQLTSLDRLHLYGNQITSIPAGVFDQLTSLDRLRLDSNQLTSLPTGIFDPVLPLTILEVGANLWNCSTDPSAVVVPSPGVTGCPGNSVLCATCGSVNQASKADTGSTMMAFLLAGASVVAVLRTI